MDIRDVRRLYDMHAILNNPRRSIVCPLPGHLHHNNTPSFGIYYKRGYQTFYCYGHCQKGGDVIDLVGYLEVPHYDSENKEHVQRAIGILTNRTIQPPVPPPPTPTLMNMDMEVYLPFGDMVQEYAKGRGLAEETLLHFKVGQTGKFMAIPTYQDEMLTMVKLRNMIGGFPRYMSIPGSKASLFNHDAVKYTSRPVLIVKGEIAAMVLHQYGFLACAPNAGEGKTLPEWYALLVHAHRVVVGDNDPGNEQTRKLAHERAEILRAELRFPPEQYKDIDEWVLADPNAVSQIQGWTN